MRRVWPLRFDTPLSINVQGTLRQLHAANSTRLLLSGLFYARKESKNDMDSQR